METTRLLRLYLSVITIKRGTYIKSELDAEELAGALFANLWMNRHSIDISKSFHAYLHAIARNSSLNFLKRKYLHDTFMKRY